MVLGYKDSAGLSPRKIVKRAEDRKKTTILEFTNTGQSLASFALLLFGWAAEEGMTEELNNSLDIVTFARFNSLPPVTTLNIVPLDLILKCKNIYAENALLVRLANGVDKGAKSDRIVPSYRHQSWDNPPQPLVENSELVATISNHLQQAVSRAVTQERESRQQQVGLF